MKKLLQIFMALLVITAIACTKEGPQGPAGTNGTNGTDGNANVKVLLWNTPPTGVANGINRYDFTFTHANITTDIINNGAILVYVSYSSTSWDYAPYWYSTTNYASVFFYNSPTPKVVLSKAASFVDKVRIVLIGGPSSGTTVVNRMSSAWNKLTEIEKAKLLYPDVDFNNYSTVNTYFNFKD